MLVTFLLQEKYAIPDSLSLSLSLSLLSNLICNQYISSWYRTFLSYIWKVCDIRNKNCFIMLGKDLPSGLKMRKKCNLVSRSQNWFAQWKWNFFEFFSNNVPEGHSEPENLKQSRQKNSWNQINQFHEIACLAVLNFFPVQKLIFGHF